MQQHLISFIIAVNEAEEGDLSIPLSSINNQLGIDFRRVQVILVDNGRYRLNDPGTFRLFKNLQIEYLTTDEVLTWEDAFNRGIKAADGKFLMFMGPDGQLNQTNVIQNFATVAQKNPTAELLSGVILEQDMTKTRTTEYRVGRDFATARGRWISRDLLKRTGVQWTAIGQYSDELFSRLLNSLSRSEVEVDGVAYARFLSRNVREDVMAPKPAGLTVAWVKMMSHYLDTLNAIDNQTYQDEFARIVVRFYTQAQQVAPADRGELMLQMKQLIKVHDEAWRYTKAFVKMVRAHDTSQAAPWNSHPQQFNAYIQSIDNFVLKAS